MTLLLDTHVIIWLFANPRRISNSLREEIANAPSVAVSVVSAWEYEQKRAKFPSGDAVPFADMLTDTEFRPLDFPFDCHVHASGLPNIHDDPFDRMLIAHSIHIGATLVTRDKDVRRYPLETLWR